jgi:hypothetical protein
MNAVYVARALRCDFDLRDGCSDAPVSTTARGCVRLGFMLSMIESDGAMNQPE